MSLVETTNLPRALATASISRDVAEKEEAAILKPC
jgi:hypothetical protein